MSESKSMMTILLLISDTAVREIIRDILTREGYLVIPTSEIGVAIDRLKELKPDLLLIRPDIHSMSGHEAALYLRTKCPGMRVLMVGGLPEHPRLDDRESLQNIHVFPKPFAPQELIGKVEEMLALPV
ncbi:MAG TPA: response regulator [Bryobacteraceae bacterium]|jgi:DNA-binding NtrC family response regulator|nr:response regulator [Bryobacteraceae bacterium]